LISTISIGFLPAGSSLATTFALASFFGFMVGLGSSVFPEPNAMRPAEARARAARAVVEAILILVMSIPFNKVWARSAAPPEADPVVAASTVDRINAAGTLAEAPLGTRLTPTARDVTPRRVRRAFNLCRALASRHRTVGTVQRSCSAACS
jgi:hypothetical protein